MIESTGVSDPAEVAGAFEHDPAMAELAQLDTMVTVVDAAAFQDNFASIATFGEGQATDHDHSAHADEAEKEECEVRGPRGGWGGGGRVGEKWRVLS